MLTSVISYHRNFHFLQHLSICQYKSYFKCTSSSQDSRVLIRAFMVSMRESCSIFLFIIIFLWPYCLKKLIFSSKFVVGSHTWGEHEDSSPKGCWGAGCILPTIKKKTSGENITRMYRNVCKFFTFIFLNHSLLWVCKNSKHSTPSGTRTADPTRWTWCSCSWRGGGAGWLSAAQQQITWARPRSRPCRRQTRGRVTGAETQYPARKDIGYYCWWQTQ